MPDDLRLSESPRDAESSNTTRQFRLLLRMSMTHIIVTQSLVTRISKQQWTLSIFSVVITILDGEDIEILTFTI